MKIICQSHNFISPRNKFLNDDLCAGGLLGWALEQFYGREEGGLSRGRSLTMIQFQQKPLSLPEGSLKLGWPFRYVQNRSNRVGPSYKHID